MLLQFLAAYFGFLLFFLFLLLFLELVGQEVEPISAFSFELLVKFPPHFYLFLYFLLNLLLDCPCIPHIQLVFEMLQQYLTINLNLVTCHQNHGDV